MHVLFLTLFAIVSLRVKCRGTVAHGSLESMQTQRGHLFADLVHVLNVSAKILLSCVASVSARVRPESFVLSPTFCAIDWKRLQRSLKLSRVQFLLFFFFQL